MIFKFPAANAAAPNAPPKPNAAPVTAPVKAPTRKPFQRTDHSESQKPHQKHLLQKPQELLPL